MGARWFRGSGERDAKTLTGVPVPRACSGQGGCFCGTNGFRCCAEFPPLSGRALRRLHCNLVCISVSSGGHAAVACMAAGSGRFYFF